jgi:hypothetical protein
VEKMKYVLLGMALMVFLFVGVSFAMVEAYRIEMDSYNTRMAAFYDNVFQYLQSDKQPAELEPAQTTVNECIVA